MWFPHVTVAAIIEHNGRYLLVEEQHQGKLVFNQPAGHLEDQETLIEAVIREVREETARHFEPEFISGIYQWRHPQSGNTYLRFCFSGQCGERMPSLTLDPDITATHWFSLDEIKQRTPTLRSPLVMRCIEDYLRGQRLTLDLVNTL